MVYKCRLIAQRGFYSIAPIMKFRNIFVLYEQRVTWPIGKTKVYDEHHIQITATVVTQTLAINKLPQAKRL